MSTGGVRIVNAEIKIPAALSESGNSVATKLILLFGRQNNFGRLASGGA